MSSPSKSQAAAKVTGVLLCRDRVAIHLGGRGQDSVKALHGAASVFAEGELQGLLSGAISDGLLGAKVAVGVDPLLEFFSTQRSIPMKDGGKAESLIEELRNKYGGRLVVEAMRTALPPKTHQTAIAVPKGELQETAEAFAEFGAGRVKFVSTTHALHAMAADEDPAPRGSRSTSTSRSSIIGDADTPSWETFHQRSLRINYPTRKWHNQGVYETGARSDTPWWR